jgi:predicted alpha/beta superfamily hydrolase
MKTSLFLLTIYLSLCGISTIKAQNTDTLYAELDLTQPISSDWFDTELEIAGLRGDQPPLSWGTTFTATDPDKDGIYSVAIPFSFEPDSMIVSLKIKIDGTDNPDDGWQKGRNHTIVLHKNEPDSLFLKWEDEAPAPTATITGQVEVFRDFTSKNLVNRDLYIYLPPDYQESEQHYPVLYLHDGQNVFNASATGQEWKVDEAAQELIQKGEIEPVIIVGIANTSDRFDEYTPTRQYWRHELTRISGTLSQDTFRNYTGQFISEGKDTLRFASRNDTLFTWIPGGTNWQRLIKKSDSVFYQPQAGITFRFEDNLNQPIQNIIADKPPAGGKGDIYTDSILNEVKPFIDENLRTKPGREFTSLGGSSLGGLITLHIGLKHPDVFSQLLVVSPSVWWDEQWILQQVQNLLEPTGQRIWLDIGTAEGASAVQNTRVLRDLLMDIGWTEKSLNYVEAENAPHNEQAWAERVPEMLRFLYGNEK